MMLKQNLLPGLRSLEEAMKKEAPWSEDPAQRMFFAYILINIFMKGKLEREFYFLTDF